MSFRDASSFFVEPLIAYLGETWETWLGPSVRDLPEFDAVAAELRPQLEEILG